MRQRGILLFLFVPLVLFLFLQQPMGTLPSLFLGILIMVGHRFLAAPFAESHREHRCLWCGRDLGRGDYLSTLVQAPRQAAARYLLCSAEERDCGSRWSGLEELASRGGVFMRLGIGLPLVHYLVAETYRGVRGSSWISHENNVLLFQAGIALTVVSISLLYLRCRESPKRAVRPHGANPPPPSGTFPFPVHNLTLLGAGWILWIFRIVGSWWLLRVAYSLLSR